MCTLWSVISVALCSLSFYAYLSWVRLFFLPDFFKGERLFKGLLTLISDLRIYVLKNIIFCKNRLKTYVFTFDIVANSLNVSIDIIGLFSF